MKKEKNKVGRPRLADKKLKKKALLMVLFSVILVIILTLAGSVTTLSVDTNRLKAASTTKEICSSIKLADGDSCQVATNKAVDKIIWNCNKDYYITSFRICEGKDVLNCSTEIMSKKLSRTNGDSYLNCGTYAIETNEKKGLNLKNGKYYFASAYVMKSNGGAILPSIIGVSNSKPQQYKSNATTNKKNNTCAMGLQSKSSQNARIYWDCTGSATPKKIYLEGVSGTKESIKTKTGDVNFDKLVAGKTYKAVLEYNNGTDEKAYYKFSADKSETEKFTNASGVTDESNRKSAKRGFAEGKVDDDIEIKPGSGLECDNDLKDLIQKYWGWVMILGPIGLMILISIDFVKAVVSSDADMLKKSGLAVFKRTLALVILLFTPFILNLVLGWFGINLCF